MKKEVFIKGLLLFIAFGIWGSADSFLKGDFEFGFKVLLFSIGIYLFAAFIIGMVKETFND